LLERKRIYEELYPGTKRGGLPGAPGGGKQAKSEIISSFAEDTADKTGQPSRLEYSGRDRRDIRRVSAECTKDN